MLKIQLRRKITKSLLIMFFVAIFLPGMPVFMQGILGSNVNANQNGYTVSDAVYKTVNYYIYNKNILNHWEETLALSRLDVDLSDQKWTLPKWNLENFNQDKTAWEYAGPILGLISIGENPNSMGGRDLVAELIAKQKVNGSFGEAISDTCWAIIALEAADGSYNKNAAIEYLIAQQNSNGGFAIFNKGEPSGPDTTGAALIALASKDSVNTEKAIIKAVQYLNDTQLESGGFKYDNNESPSSIALAMIGLLANNEEITNAKWIKNDRTMIDALMTYQLEDGSFSSSKGGFSNPMATQQGLLALSYLVEKYGNYVINNNLGIPNQPDIKPEVRLRIEGRTSTLFDEVIELDHETTGLELLMTAIGQENVVSIGGYISSLMGEEAVWDNDLGRSEFWGIYTVKDNQLMAAFEGLDTLSIAGIDELLLHFKDGYITKDPIVTINKDGVETKITVKQISETWTQNPDTGEWSSTATEEAVEGVTLTINGQAYTTNANGQVSVQLPAGNYTARIEKPGETYPELIRVGIKFSVQEVINPGGPGGQQPTGITVQIAVIGKDGEVLARPTTVNLPNNSNVLEGLSKVGLSYKVTDGYVSEISGQKEREKGSQSGWKYKVNGIAPSSTAAGDYKLNSGDRVIWWYALTANDPGPSWSDLTEAVRTGGPIQQVKVPEKTGDELVKEIIGKGQEIKISLEDREQPSITFERDTMQKIIESNKPLIIKNAGVEVHFNTQVLATEKITNSLANENISIEIAIKELPANQSKALLYEINANNTAKLVNIGGRTFEFSFHINTKHEDGSISSEKITEFEDYLPITLDLSQIRLRNEDVSNLTAIRYQQDEKGKYIPVKLGGTYNFDDKAFVFYTNRFSLYGVMKAEELTKIKLGISKMTTIINGERSWSDVPPTIINNRTMVPIRFIAEALGAQVAWEEKTQTVFIKQDNKKINFPIGQLLEGMDTPATIVNGRTLVPLRYISENLGAYVMWFPTTQTIEIIK